MIKNNQEHFTIEQLDRYVNGEMNFEEAFAVDEHLAECAECAQTARTIRGLNAAWNQWTAKSHGEQFKQNYLADSLRKAAATNPGIQERISNWLEQRGACAGGAVQVVLKLPDEISRFITGGLESLVKPQPCWNFAYAATGLGKIRTRGIEGPKDKTRVKAPGAPGIEVSLDEAAGEIMVKITGIAPDQAAPLAILVPDEAEYELLVSTPEYNPEIGCHITKFQAIPPGKYCLVFEPV